MKPVAHVLFALAVAGVQAALLRWVGGGAFSLALPAACVVYVALHGGTSTAPSRRRAWAT